MKKVALLLCGSGFKDGSEIRETVGVLWALSCYKINVQCFALNLDQRDVVNCLNQTEMNEKRNQLTESARIARGNVLPLEQIQVTSYDGIIIPGGFGVAKNLCDFAFKGAEAAVNPLVSDTLQAFKKLKKPIGAVCIAPVLLALTFKNAHFELTVGKASDAANAIEKLGHKHIVKNADDAHCDFQNKIVTTPAYMYDNASLEDIFTGISKMTKGFSELL